MAVRINSEAGFVDPEVAQGDFVVSLWPMVRLCGWNWFGIGLCVTYYPRACVFGLLGGGQN